MAEDHEIVEMIYAAKENSKSADALILKYMPFIKSETSGFLGRAADDSDDELSIAMYAFHEAALSYDKRRGAFLPLAKTAIKNRLIDYRRKESKHDNIISIHSSLSDDNEYTVEDTVVDKNDSGDAYHTRSHTREEIEEFSEQLKDFGLSLLDIADSCPKQKRTLLACHRALSYAKKERELLISLVKTKRLPIDALSKGSGVPVKTLERHRKYMVAILLAYTNGYEIIRGHLSQLVTSEEERNI